MDNQQHHTASQSGSEKSYTCPMHPQIHKSEPGLCPLCGMNLIPEKNNNNLKEKSEHQEQFNKHAGHNLATFARKFWWSLIITIPVVLLSELPQNLLGYKIFSFSGDIYISLLLSSIVYFYGGWVFLRGAFREIQARLPGMMTLIGIAISAAYFFSIYATFADKPTLFWELTTLITVMLLGHWIEMRAVQNAQGALKELSKLLPDTAEVLRNGQTVIITLTDLKVDDLMIIKPGDKIPADGTVTEGQSELNESMVTGESAPVQKTAGAEVIAGTINGDGSLTVKVKNIGEKTFLAGVMRLVAQAQASKSRLQILSDQAAFYLTIIALSTGTITFMAWLISGAGISFSVERLVAVLVIACPHALGLAVPLVASISTTMAAKNGLLIKQRLSLEAARDINIVLFDKTGTLTEGQFGVDEIIVSSKLDKMSALALAASVNQGSEHPIAHAIIQKAQKEKIEFKKITEFKRLPGIGAQAIIDGHTISVGSIRLLEQRKLEIDVEQKKQLDKLSHQGKTVIYLLSDDNFLAAFALADVIREESREAVRSLKELGIKVAMITGDSDEVAAWVAKELNIDEYFARVLPDQKSSKVKLLQDKGLRVAMVGDGVNDAPALTQSDVGIAIGAGTNVAIESAGIILVKNDPRDIPKIVKLSKLTYKKMMQNIFWATGYNIIALPLAAGILVNQGIILQPAVSALLMSLSTVIVAFNAIMLRRQSL